MEVPEKPAPRGQSIKWRRDQSDCFFQIPFPDWEISTIQGLEVGSRVTIEHSSPRPPWPLVCYRSALGDNYLADYRLVFFDVNLGVAFRARHQFVVPDGFSSTQNVISHSGHFSIDISIVYSPFPLNCLLIS